MEPKQRQEIYLLLPASAEPQQSESQKSENDYHHQKSEKNQFYQHFPSDSDDPDPEVKPIVQKPVSKSIRLKSRAKRPATEIDKSSSSSSSRKKSKMIIGDYDEEGDDQKSVTMWSESDEIVLLNMIIQYNSDNGVDLNSDFASFYEYVRDSISVDPTNSQLYEKIRWFKNKFLINTGRMHNGEDVLLLMYPHQRKMFDLSQKIWGDGDGCFVKSSGNKKDRNVVGNNTNKLVGNKDIFLEVKDAVFWSLYPRASLESDASTQLKLMPMDSKEFVKEVISALGKEKARKMEEGWKCFDVMEYQLYAMRVKLIKKQTDYLLDAFKHSNLKYLRG